MVGRIDKLDPETSMNRVAIGLAMTIGIVAVGCAAQRGQAGCATCVFDMQGVTGCVLAIKIDGQAYLVEGSDIDDHGDAHAGEGLCNTARPAEFEGKIVDGKLVATRFALESARNE